MPFCRSSLPTVPTTVHPSGSGSGADGPLAAAASNSARFSPLRMTRIFSFGSPISSTRKSRTASAFVTIRVVRLARMRSAMRRAAPFHASFARSEAISTGTPAARPATRPSVLAVGSQVWTMWGWNSRITRIARQITRRSHRPRLFSR